MTSNTFSEYYEITIKELTHILDMADMYECEDAHTIITYVFSVGGEYFIKRMKKITRHDYIDLRGEEGDDYIVSRVELHASDGIGTYYISKKLIQDKPYLKGLMREKTPITLPIL